MPNLKRKSRDDEFDIGYTNFPEVNFGFDDTYEYELNRAPYPSPPSRAYTVESRPQQWAQLPPVNTIPRLQPTKPIEIDNQLARLVYSPIDSKPNFDSPRLLIQPPKKRSRDTVPKVGAPEGPTQITSDCGTRTWIIIKSLGKGGCGEVYLCSESGAKPSDLVAVKVIKERKQFNAELSTMKSLASHACGRGNN